MGRKNRTAARIVSAMSLAALCKGIAIGFAIAAPVGPIGVLCIRRTLAEGRLTGFVSGLGAASADAIFGSLAAFGLTLVSEFLVRQQGLFRLVGGFFLLYLGIKIATSRPADKPASIRGEGLLGAYASTLFLTLTNPMSILAFAAIFAGLGASGASGNPWGAASLVAGVFLGSASWWLILSAGVGLFRSRLGPPQLLWVNRLAGAVVAAFGSLAIASLLRR